MKNKIVVGDTDLATLKPGLLKEWDYEKNKELKPTDVTIYSNKKIWWICEKGHSWQAIIASRSKGSGCPYCGGKRVIQGETDLATLNPELVKEWNYEKNGDLAPIHVSTRTNKKVWWRCEKGHEWEMSIASRSKGKNCPQCAGRGISYGKGLSEKLLKEWDYEKNTGIHPENLLGNSHKKVWWKCRQGHSWEAIVENRSGGQGCPYCSGRQAIVGETDLATLKPGLLKEWDYEKNGDLQPNQVTISSGKRVWWKCEKGHKWEAIIFNRAIRGNRCPYCSGKRAIQGETDLKTLYPHLADEWDYEKNGELMPEQVMARCKKRVWWKCAQGHSWEAIVSNRSAGSGCPYCSGKKEIKEKTDQDANPSDATGKIDYEHNKNI